VVVPIEIKTSNDPLEKNQGSIVQLLAYMRQILKEQQDRRFVFGILLFHRSLSLWYCDRSGVLGTSCLIDIDKVRFSPVSNSPIRTNFFRTHCAWFK